MTAKLPPPTIEWVSYHGKEPRRTVDKRFWDEAAVLQAVREALERAAQKCEQQDYAEDCANAIRALAKEYE